MTRNRQASTLAYRGTDALFRSGAQYAAVPTAVQLANMHAARVAAINSAANIAANQQMLASLAGIGMSIYGKDLFPIYHVGPRGGVYRYTSGGNKSYIS